MVPAPGQSDCQNLQTYILTSLLVLSSCEIPARTGFTLIKTDTH